MSSLFQKRLARLSFALTAVFACAPRASSPPAVEPAFRTPLGPAERQKLDVAASVCAAAVQGKGSGARVGCRSCPPFDADHGPDGRVVMLAEPSAPGATTAAEFFELELVLAGSFSRAGANEAAAIFNGCEPHSENWGGTLLVERKGSGWSPVSYRSGFHPARCVVVPAANLHDLLVCSWASTHQGHTAWMLDVYDFTRGNAAQPEVGWDRLMTLVDDAVASCWDDGDPRISVGSIDQLSVSTPGASPLRVLVDVSFGSGPKTAKVKADCHAALEQGDQAVHVGASLTTKKTRLEFERHGNRIVASAATQAFIEDGGEK